MKKCLPYFTLHYLVIFERHPHHMLFKVPKWKKKIHPRVNRVGTVQKSRKKDPFKTSIQTLRYLSKKYRPDTLKLKHLKASCCVYLPTLPYLTLPYLPYTLLLLSLSTLYSLSLFTTLIQPSPSTRLFLPHSYLFVLLLTFLCHPSYISFYASHSRHFPKRNPHFKGLHCVTKLCTEPAHSALSLHSKHAKLLGPPFERTL